MLGSGSGGPRPYRDVTEWHLTPKWQWRYWLLGQQWRRLRFPHWDNWEYQTHQQRARAVLEDLYLPKGEQSAVTFN